VDIEPQFVLKASTAGKDISLRVRLSVSHKAKTEIVKIGFNKASTN